jgi:hypothetical protein
VTNQLTIRYEDELARAIDDLARRESISLNQAALRLLRKGAGLDRPERSPDVVGDSLDWFIGSWTADQAAALERAVADFESVDEELWK